MKSIIWFVTVLLALPLQLCANWLDDVNTIHAEIQSLTANEQGLDGKQRLERYYELSYALVILESPGFATDMGDPRGQDRLGDYSEAGSKEGSNRTVTRLPWSKASIAMR